MPADDAESDAIWSCVALTSDLVPEDTVALAALVAHDAPPPLVSMTFTVSLSVNPTPVTVSVKLAEDATVVGDMPVTSENKIVRNKIKQDIKTT